MIIAIEGLMFIYGVVALISGTLPSGSRGIHGWPARVGGIILMIPLAFILPLGWAMADNSSSFMDAFGKVLVLHIVGMIVCFLGAYIVAGLLTPLGGDASHRRWLKEMKTKKRSRRRRPRDEDDVSRRRRPVPEDEEDDDDRPRRRPADDYDDDDRPRRRPDDDDDYDDDDGPPRRRRSRDYDDDDD